MDILKKQKGISVIIPVYNEASFINRAVDNLLNSKEDCRIEVIVAGTDDQDSTLDAIESSEVITVRAPRGRARQMNYGSRHAGEEILLFLHADTILPPRAFEKILTVFETTESVAGAFDLSLDNPALIYRLIGRWASRKHRLTRVPFGDQAIFLKKDFFDEIGGYPDIPLMEDVELMKGIKRMNREITILPDAVISSARKWEREGPLRSILRNWSIQALYLLGVSPGRLARYYYGGKAYD